MKTSLRRLTAAALGLALFTLSVQGEDYYYVTKNGTITITGYTGPGGAVSIPSTINGLPVTRIGYDAFTSCTSLTSVIIPDSVISIERSLEGGGGSAFSHCISLTNVVIGSGVISIDWAAFSDCPKLLAITVHEQNPSYQSLDGVLFSKNMTDLLLFPCGRTGRSYIIPSNVVRLFGAFAGCTSLTNVTIPDGLTLIGGEAFSGCTSLTSVTIPDSVTMIWHSAFSGCTHLTSVTVGSRLDNVFGAIGQRAFAQCNSLTSVYCKGDAPTLGASVFDGANNVSVYYLPGTTGWSDTFGGRPTAPWLLPYPVILTTPPNFGIQNNAFGYRISWATNISVVVETSTTLANPIWSPVSTNALVNGWSYFSDPQWNNYPSRSYRIRSL